MDKVYIVYDGDGDMVEVFSTEEKAFALVMTHNAQGIEKRDAEIGSGAEFKENREALLSYDSYYYTATSVK